jgi:ATP-binding cassette subfamily C protein
LTTDIWIEPKEKVRLSCADTASSLASESALDGLRLFQRLSLLLWLEKAKAQRAEEFQRLQHKAEAEAQVVDQAIRRLTGVMKAPDAAGATADADPLLRVFRLIAHELDVPVNVPSNRAASSPSLTPLADLARGSRLRVRRVALREGWWTRAMGPMIGSTGDDNRPIALLPLRSGSGFEAVDPATGARVRVTRETAGEIGFFASAFYRPLPEHALKAWDLFKAGLRESGHDARRLALLGIGSSVLGWWCRSPRADHQRQHTGGRSFRTAADRGSSDRRHGGGRSFEFQQRGRHPPHGGEDGSRSAERPLGSAPESSRHVLPPLCFRRSRGPGDGYQPNPKMLTDTAIASLLSAVFSLFSVGLLFYYSAQLAAVALSLVLLMVIVTAIVSYRQVNYQRQLYALSGKLDGLVFQMLTGISKLRVAKAEGRAFGVWANLFATQKQLALRSRTDANFLETFNAAFSIVAVVAMFVGFAVLLKGALAPGSFSAFSAAFGSFVAAMLGLSHSLISLLQVVPLYERARPILESEPEINLSKAEPGLLNGQIELSRIFFRYHPEGPPILQDVSFRVAPTEFIALAGASGSGKSTLFRLMLGLKLLRVAPCSTMART